MVTPEEITDKVFSLVRRGYDPAEVDDFLREVATSLSDAQAGAAPAPEITINGPDDFGRLGDEVAQILRQAHESVAALRHRAEAEAALIRQDAQREVETLRTEADRDRQQASVELEAARGEAARILADVRAQADRAADDAAALAAARAGQVVDRARIDARDAVLAQRNVRDRLEGTREDIDRALERLVEEDEDLFAIDLTDDAVAEDAALAEPPDDAPPPGQGPPSAPVPPPVRPAYDLDLPYAEDDDDEPVDLTGEDEPPEPDDGLGASPPPTPPADQPGGVAADVPTDAGGDGNDDEDALAQMVKNAVENALRRRKGDADPGDGNGV